MSSSLRNLRIFPLLLLISYLQPCHNAPAPFLSALPSLETVQTAMERAADYGYQMLGYGHHEDDHGYGHHEDDHGYGHHEHDHVIVKDKPTLWDGHIGVPDFVSPLIAKIPEIDIYGKDKDKDKGKIVKGHDGRLGFRLAVPYFGDFQYVREYGPGRFTDKLGPGHYNYPGLDYKPKKEKKDKEYKKGKKEKYNHYGYHDPKPHHGYHDPKPSDIYVPEPQQEVYHERMYEGLQNYPWNVNK